MEGKLRVCGLIALLLFTCHSIAQGFTEFKEPGPGEISKDKAITSCQQFCKKLKLPMPEGKLDMRKLLQYEGNIVLYYMRYQNYLFVLKSNDGTVVRFRNEYRQRQIAKGVFLNKQKVVRNETIAKIKLVSFANDIGLPEGCRLSDVRFQSFKEPNNSGPSDEVSGLFAKYHKGYGAIGGLGGIEVILDQQDGVILNYAATKFDIVFESDTAKLSFEEAKQYALKTQKAYQVGETRDSDAVKGKTKAQSLLQYVRPNGKYGGLNYSPNKFPWRLRLAWVLKYSNGDHIWVDAGNGRILGGFYIQSGGTHP